MRTWKKVRIIGTAAIAAILGLTALPRHDAEPEYQGRSLRFWLLASQRDTNPEDPAEALAHFGTNALPFLLKWIRYERSPARIKVAKAIPSALQKFARPFITSERELLAETSAEGFRHIVTNGTLAVPELTNLIHKTNAPQTAIRAMRALTLLGTNGLPPLIAAAQDQQYPFRFFAVGMITWLPNESRFADITTPVLIGLLSDRTHPEIAPVAAMGLGRNPNAPDTAIPALISCLTSPTAPEQLRAAAAESLGAFGAQAANALPALSNILTDPNFTVRFFATNAIARIHVEPATNGRPR
ncbi:MAG TPA: HEAT repeat domain-containing protein [Candidatus Binatia bacterium]|jgi:hypothetical protein|nr:HEAT repeat domain-containing protein [Candidatus Binatia bacterium]